MVIDPRDCNPADVSPTACGAAGDTFFVSEEYVRTRKKKKEGIFAGKVLCQGSTGGVPGRVLLPLRQRYPRAVLAMGELPTGSCPFLFALHRTNQRSDDLPQFAS